MKTSFGFYVSEPQYWSHLRPVWAALDPDERGGLWTPKKFKPAGFVEPSKGGTPQYWVTASFKSAKDAFGVLPMPVVYFEHGVGIAGANGTRNGVTLFCAPNEFIAERYRKGGPQPVEVVGQPKMRELAAISHRPKSRPVVCLSIHWTSPKLYLKDWAMAVAMLSADPSVELMLHCHPRFRDQLGSLVREARFVDDFEEVVHDADVYASNFGSTPFEWAALDRPGIVIDSRHPNSEMWEAYKPGVRIASPFLLRPAIDEALEDSPALAEERQRIRADLYPYWDNASERAVEVLRTLETTNYGRPRAIGPFLDRS